MRRSSLNGNGTDDAPPRHPPRKRRFRPIPCLRDPAACRRIRRPEEENAPPPCLHPPRKALPLIRSARQHPLPRRPLPEAALSHRPAPATHDAQAGRSSAPLPVQDGQEKRILSEEHLSRPGRPAARSPERKHSLRPSCSSSPALHPKGSLPCPATAKRQAAAGGGPLASPQERLPPLSSRPGRMPQDTAAGGGKRSPAACIRPEKPGHAP